MKFPVSRPDPKRRKELKRLAKELRQRERQRLDAVREAAREAGFAVPATDPTWAERYKAGLTREIDRETGEVVFDSGLRLNRGLSRKEFLQSEWGRRATPTWPNASNMSLSLGSQAIGGTAVYLRLCFGDEYLLGVDLYLEEKPPAGDWLSGRIAAQDHWLEILFGKPPYDFPWGTVRSEFDQKEVEAWISVSYRTRRPVSTVPIDVPD